MNESYVYIVTNKRNGTLYIGVTSNLKQRIYQHKNSWIMGLKKNRKVNKNQELQALVIPEEGLRVHLRGNGWITVFRFVHTNGRTDYIGTNQEAPIK